MCMSAQRWRPGAAPSRPADTVCYVLVRFSLKPQAHSSSMGLGYTKRHSSSLASCVGCLQGPTQAYHNSKSTTVTQAWPCSMSHLLGMMCQAHNVSCLWSHSVLCVVMTVHLSQCYSPPHLAAAQPAASLSRVLNAAKVPAAHAHTARHSTNIVKAHVRSLHLGHQPAASRPVHAG